MKLEFSLLLFENMCVSNVMKIRVFHADKPARRIFS